MKSKLLFANFLFCLCLFKIHAQVSQGVLPRDLFANDAKLGVSVYLYDGDKDPEARNKKSFNYLKGFLEKELKGMGFVNPVVLYLQEENYKVDGNVQAALMAQGATHYMNFSVMRYPNDNAFEKGKGGIEDYRDITLQIAPITMETIYDYDYTLTRFRDFTSSMDHLKKDIQSVPGDFFTEQLQHEREEKETEAFRHYPDDLDKEGVLYVKGTDSRGAALDKDVEALLNETYPFKFKVVDTYEYELEKNNYKYKFGLQGSSYYITSNYYYFQEISTGNKYYGHEHGNPSAGGAMKDLIELVKIKYGKK